jgi:Zn-dependent protease with chaperone function
MQPHRFVKTMVSAAKASEESVWARRWRRIARAIRYTRIPLLILSVYSLGYQQGVMECIRTPQALQGQILSTILISAGVKNEKQVETVSEKDVKFWSTSSRTHQVASIGHQIVCAARRYVVEQLEAAIQQVSAQLPADVTPEQAQAVLLQDERVQYWNAARMRLCGEDIQQPWYYHFIASPHPNAFVSEILPRRFFITTAMLDIARTPDELALVLGHEVSHLILGHVSASNQLETFLRTLEVLLLSIDPTQGVIALGVIGFLAIGHKALAAAYSRQHEREADELGLVLAARACFNTQKGVQVMHTMHQHHVSAEPHHVSNNSSLVQLMDTHPPSLERYHHLQQMSFAEQPKKYAHCEKISTRFWSAVWGSRPRPDEPGEPSSQADQP